MSSLGSIFNLQPFEPERILILPYEGGEITLYVLKGRAYVIPVDEADSARSTINCVHFAGWSPGFRNAKLDIPARYLFDTEKGLKGCELDVAFRLVSMENRAGQTAEIVAISYDGCETFHNNELVRLL